MHEIILKSGASVRLIGDPHMGRSFENGVPLNRRGEREQMQLAQLKQELNGEADYIVIVGDLFDHPYVSLAVILDVYKAVVNAAAARPETRFVVMAGNHDVPRNLEAVGAFAMLETMCHLRADNLHVISKPAQIGPLALYPWQWNVRADEQQVIQWFTDLPVELVIGHWDMKVFGDSDSHLAPTKMLTERHPGAPIWSGHYHVPGEYVIDGITVNCTGSMQPYSHGEDPDGAMYLTLTPAEIESIKPELLRDKCVRVLLTKGEEMPTGIDCLALTPKRLAEEDEGKVAITLGDFSWNEILVSKLVDLPKPVVAFIKERLNG